MSVVFTRKAVVDGTLNGSQRMCASLLLELKPVSFILLNVSINAYWLPYEKRVQEGNCLLSKRWSCHIFNDFEQTVQLKVLLPLVDKTNLIVSV